MRAVKAVILVFLALFPTLPCRAQRVCPQDSTAAFNPTQLIAPGILLGSGVAIHYFAHDTWDIAVRERMLEMSGGNTGMNFDDFIQYAPLVMDLGLGFTGVNARHCFLDRTIEAALAYACTGILCWSGKTLLNTMRPNGANDQSFPSGHCSFVFTGAELVRREYGWGWGAGAYTVAVTVAFMRMYRDWHWFSDVLAGAGVGILCANIGCWLLDPTKRLFGIELPEKLQFAVVPSVDPFNKTFGTSLSIRF